MALESGTYISDLVSTNPTASDPKSQGDDHLRLVKTVTKASFPNITGAMTATHTSLSNIAGPAINVKNSTYGATGDGVTNDTTAVQAALTAGAGGAVFIPAGTYMVSGLTVPANTLVYGAGPSSILKLRANADVISTIGVHSVLQNFKIDGNGAAFTGRGVVVSDGGVATITDAWWRRFVTMDIVNTGGYCIEFVATRDGYQSEMLGGNYTRYNYTGASVKFPTTETNGNRRMIGIMCSANPIVDLGGSDNSLVLGCEGWCPIYSSTTKKARVIGNRIYSGTGITLDGVESMFANNIVADTTVTLSATLLASVISANKFAEPQTLTYSISAAAGNSIRDMPRVTTYVPTWTGGSPAIGNGLLNASYVLNGNTCQINIQLVAGTTTTFGSGAWTFGLPFTALARSQAGSGVVVHGAATYSLTPFILANNSTLQIAASSSTSLVGSAVPMAWASADGLYLSFEYIIA